MRLRLSGSLILATVALIGAVLARPVQTGISFDPVSHGAGACDPDGVMAGYVVSFSDAAPRGFKVTEVSVRDLAPACQGNEITVGLLTADASQLATSAPIAIDSSSMTFAVSPHPLAAQVGAISVTIEGEALPPVTPDPVRIPDPPASTPNLDNLPEDVCAAATHICGTKHDDVISISHGALITGPGKDKITITTDASTRDIAVDAGADEDRIALSVNASPGTPQEVSIRSGLGADIVMLSFDSVPTGSIVEVTINTGAGADVVELPAFLPGGVTIKLVTGPDDDMITTSGTGSTGAPGGYRIDAGRGDDSVQGGLGPDLIAGRAGADRINGGAGSDVLAGHGGDDRLAGGTGWDMLVGGWGRDTCLGSIDAGAARSCEVDFR